MTTQKITRQDVLQAAVTKRVHGLTTGHFQLPPGSNNIGRTGQNVLLHTKNGIKTVMLTCQAGKEERFLYPAGLQDAEVVLTMTPEGWINAQIPMENATKEDWDSFE